MVSIAAVIPMIISYVILWWCWYSENKNVRKSIELQKDALKLIENLNEANLNYLVEIIELKAKR